MVFTSENLRKAQLLQLQILKEVHRICEKHSIKYFLSDGTLIGAVRHKGFIPWDDDIDIGMLRDEYEKFCSICSSDLPDEYFLQTMEMDSEYAMPFGKVMLKHTVWIEENCKHTEKYSGVYIDIFPYDAITKDRFKQSLQRIIYILLFYTLRRRKKYDTPIQNLKKRIVCLISFFFFFLSDDKLRMMINTTMMKYRHLSSTEDCFITKFGGDYYKNQNPKRSFEILIMGEFEGYYFYIPAAYDSILRNLYGSYMIIPPEEERIKHAIYYCRF